MLQDLKIFYFFSFEPASSINFKVNDTLLFGRESAGVPNKIHKIINEKLKIPMSKNKRSLNLATSVGILLSEQIRQLKR